MHAQAAHEARLHLAGLMTFRAVCKTVLPLTADPLALPCPFGDKRQLRSREERKSCLKYRYNCIKLLLCFPLHSELLRGSSHLCASKSS